VVTRPARPSSLRGRLIGIALWITLVAGLCGFGVTQVASLKEAERIHDDGLRLVAQLLLGLTEHELAELSPDADLAERLAMGRGDTAATFGGKYRYQIWSSGGHFLLGNHALPSNREMARPGTTGYSWIDMDGERWRAYVMQDAKHQSEIHIAEVESAREWSGSVRGSFLLLVLPCLLLVLLPGLWLLSLALRPLAELAGELQARSSSDLQEVRLGTQLAELQPVQSALNTLFGRVSDAIRRESSFTALAAHEMRTPLATMRIVAESALHAGEGPERQLALKELLDSVDRCSHLQDQLLTLARLETAGVQRLDQRFALVDLVEEALSAVAANVHDKSLHIQLDVDDAEMVGYRFGVLTLLRNLVSNAVRYAPQGGAVKVTTCRSGQDVIVRVDDNGPGIAPELHDRALERFERLNAASGSGVGLGLSIAKSVASLHETDLQLGKSPMGGLHISVTFTGRAVPPDQEGFGEVEAPDRPRADERATHRRTPVQQGL
jgi:signal transduction histidine kinase